MLSARDLWSIIRCDEFFILNVMILRLNVMNFVLRMMTLCAEMVYYLEQFR